jgi:N-acetylneuraminic acid mutarotase
VLHADRPAYVYDPATGRWTSIAPMPDRGATHAGVATDGVRYVYIAGGYVADSGWTGQVFGTKAVWRYDTVANSYTRLPDLLQDRAAGQLELLGTTLHYFGGTNPARTQDVGDHWTLDLNTPGATWQTAAPLPTPRHHMGSAVLGGFLYAIGGQTGHDDGLRTQAAVHRYDPASNAWTAVRSLPVARGHISNSTFVLNGRIVVAGGETSHTAGSRSVTAYDPANDTWTLLTDLPEARISGVAAPVGQGYVFTSGSSGGSARAGGWQASPK